MVKVFAASKYAEELEFMFLAIREGGKILLRCKEIGSDFAYKSDNSIVTQADHQCAAFLDSEIEKTFPGDAILNEETYHLQKQLIPWNQAERCWIIDPLDSTSSFIKNGQHYGIIVSLTINGEPTVAMTYKPELGEIYFAVKNEGAYRAFAGPELSAIQVLPVRVSEQNKLHLILSHGRHKTPELIELLKNLGNPNWHRMHGSLKINEVARGEYSAFVSPPQNPMCLWDLAATQVILEAAGGRMTDLLGHKLDFRNSDPVLRQGIIASNGVTHALILKRLAEAARRAN